MTKPQYCVTERHTDKPQVGHYFLYFAKFEINVTTVDTLISCFKQINALKPKPTNKTVKDDGNQIQFRFTIAVYIMNAK
jgi:hypothetical protein